MEYLKVLLTGRVKKVGCLDSSSYLPSVEPPASTDFEVVFLPIPIVSRMSRTCIQYSSRRSWDDRPATRDDFLFKQQHLQKPQKCSVIQLGHQDCFFKYHWHQWHLELKRQIHVFLVYLRFMYKYTCSTALVPFHAHDSPTLIIPS